MSDDIIETARPLSVTKAASAGREPDLFRALREKHDRVYKKLRFAVINAIPHEYAATNIVFGPSDVIPVLGKPGTKVDFVTLKDRTGGDIHVALAGTSGQGIAQAAAATALIRHRCVYLEKVILIGIAAGQPDLADNEKDVRLGDIFIGDKLIQYDHVKRTDGVTKLRGDNLQPGDPTLLETVRKLMSLQDRRGPTAPKKPWEDYIAAGVSQLRHADRPPQDHDPNQLLRKYSRGDTYLRADDQPFVHVGTVGSANTLLKDAEFRDKLNRDHAIMAYEMEGAGVAIAAASLGLQYLNVRGICDYADSAKGDKWQTYASISAASFARAVIENS